MSVYTDEFGDSIRPGMLLHHMGIWLVTINRDHSKEYADEKRWYCCIHNHGKGPDTYVLPVPQDVLLDLMVRSRPEDDKAPPALQMLATVLRR